MRALDSFYIDGAWREASDRPTLDVINPATEHACARLSLGGQGDVDDAVAAARRAFAETAATTPEVRAGWLEALLGEYQKRYGDIAAAITEEMGAPLTLAQQAQAGAGLAQLQTTITTLRAMAFEEDRDGYRLLREPIGVAGLITPWNWPINQAMCKIAPALAAGCTIVWKPSEVAPISATILAEAIAAAGLPAGAFNMVHGDGPTVGAAIAAHADVDFVSFTGSTRAGVEVAKCAAPSVKRVAQELGGKSPNVIMRDADLEAAVRHGVIACMTNSGQSCNAPTRMIVPAETMDDVAVMARTVAEAMSVGVPTDPQTKLGPVANETQWKKVQSLIEKGLAEGATLVTGGPGRPDGFSEGYYVKPTVFANVSNEMTIAREEIFGPVLSIIPYETEDEAIAIANDTPYGLTGYVYGPTVEDAARLGKRIRAGTIHLNGAGVNFNAPFGGYKQSGNGREWGALGIEEFLEVKAVMAPAA